MTAQSPTAWILSLSLHAFVAALILFFAYTASLTEKTQPTILELVAGEGDNYMATAAPAAGTLDGITVSMPNVAPPIPTFTPPEPTPEPVEVAPVVPAPAPPIAPAPKPVEPAPKAAPDAKATKAPEAVPNFAKQINWEIIRAESKAKLIKKREQEAERKRQAAEKKRLAEEAKKMTKAEFDKMTKAQSAKSPSKNAPVKIAKIDGKGIAKGVLGGSPDNTKGGANGKALTNDNADALAGYYTYFREELRRLFEPPPGLSDTLKVTIQVQNFANGTLAGAKVTRTSGSREYDRAVLDAIAKIKLPPRPDGRSESFDFIFTMRERDER